MTTYQLSGQIVARGSRIGIPNLRVETQDRDQLTSDMIAVAFTDAQGAFSMALESAYVDELFLNRSPALRFRVFNGAKSLTIGDHVWHVTRERTSMRIEVDLTSTRVGETPAPSIVRGVVRTASGAPVKSATVRAYDKQLQSETLLGEQATTEERGRYQIPYTASQTSGGKGPNLVVRAFDKDTVVAESPCICMATATATIDLTVGGVYVGPSAMDALEESLRPFLGDVVLADAKPEQLERLACMSGERVDLVAALASAGGIAKKTGVPASALYGLVRVGLPSTREGLLRTHPATLRRALEVAFEANLAPAGLRVQLERVMQALREAAVKRAFEPPQAGATGNFGDLLASSLPARANQEEFLRLYLDHDGTMEELWHSLADHPVFGERDTIPAIQCELLLGAVTRYHFPLISALRQMDATSLDKLAQYGEAQWNSLLADLDQQTPSSPVSFPGTIPGATAKEKRSNYARLLTRTLETAHPTVALAAQIEKHSTLPDKDDLVIFFKNNPSFELSTTRVVRYLADNPNAFVGIGDPATTMARLKGLERLYKVTPRALETQRLLDDGLDSAQAIRRLGRAPFVTRYAEVFGGVERASEVFKHARHMATRAVALWASWSPAMNRAGAYALPEVGSPIAALLSGSPDWEQLFGNVDACACGHCRSVYSPAAYLVDLLQFLGEWPSTRNKTAQEKWTVRDLLLGALDAPSALLGRRPDIARLEMTCENAETPLPYIDLVNEILEHAIASVVLEPDPPLPDHIATEGSSEELAALPAPPPAGAAARQAAYVALANRVYPWALPFHRWAEEARVFLNHLGVPRHTLMRVLRSDSASWPSIAAIAAEQLGLSPRERLVITGASLPDTPLQPRELWGIQEDGLWPNSLLQVRRFLTQSGLHFENLLELLETAFVRWFVADPSAHPELPRLEAQPGGDSCDPEIQQIVGLDGTRLEGAWQAIHRFLRLQRRIGYTIAKLDQATVSFQSTIDDAFLEALALVERLRARWGLPLPVALSWFGDLDARDREGRTKPSYYAQLFLNKAIKNPVDSMFALVLVTDPATAEPLRSHRDVILGALNMSAAEFDLLTDEATSQAEVGTGCELGSGPKLSLANLSKLHRIVTFSRALKLSVRDFLVLKRLRGDDPFTVATLEAFVMTVERSRAVKRTSADLMYLLRDEKPPSSPLERSSASMDAVLDTLATGFEKIEGSAEREQLIQKTLAETLKLDAKAAKLLLTSILTVPGSNSQSLLETFLPPIPPPGAAREPHYTAYRRLHKAAVLLQDLSMTAEELELLSSPAPADRLFDFDALPPGAIGDSAALLARWEILTDLAAFKCSLPAESGALSSLLKHAPTGAMQAVEALCESAGWPASEATALIAAWQPDLTTVAGVAKAALRLRDAFELLKRLGVTAGEALGWIHVEAPLPGSPPVPNLKHADVIADEILQTAKAKHTPEAWLKVAPPLRDALRDKQRRTLVAFLMAWKHYETSDPLFRDLLVDVEMSPCQLTSRIKHAVGSVQTFVQRALLNLELYVNLPEDAAREWSWRKNYRVWEANCKIFLYPENWIESGLRDDKSPFFKAFENELRQKDITADTAKEAYRHYLEKLNEVAHLDVVTVFQEDGVLHVVGATRSQPRRYFYRQREARRWTPWEKIDLDIPGDHVLLGVFRRRVYLLWPIIEEKADDHQTLPEGNTPGEAATIQYEIKLACSEYRGDRWLAPRTSTDSLKVPADRDAKWLTFILREDGAVLCTRNEFHESPDGRGIWKDYRHLGQFGLDTCDGRISVNPASSGKTAYLRLRIPDGTTTVNQQAKETPEHSASTKPWLSVWRSPESRLSGFGAWVDLFKKTPGERFRVVEPHLFDTSNKDRYMSSGTFFYNSSGRTLFVEPLAGSRNPVVSMPASPNMQVTRMARVQQGVPADVIAWSSQQILQVPASDVMASTPQYRVRLFYHPYVCSFQEELHRGGVEGLLRQRSVQSQSVDAFDARYDPTGAIEKPYPVEDVDFSCEGAYALYNWELFFHAPMLIATRLMQNQRHADAQRWFHAIFDPTAGGSGQVPQRFWTFLPFHQNLDLATIQGELEALANGEGGSELLAQIEAWQDQPFNPHLIARMRPLAYQKAIVIKYIENLLAWGDQLFRRDTIESINEATQLYRLAAGLLGPRPRLVRRPVDVAPRTYAELLAEGPDPFSNVEALLPVSESGSDDGGEPPPDLSTLYFCVPDNSALLGLWDTVEDRLFKIRHCMNIEGVVRQLPLFEPPIDPALLVQSAATGIDLSSVLNDLAAEVPRYRFSVMHAKAAELCAGTIAFGASLLSSLEKRDAEHLSQLRSGHEVELLRTLREVKAEQVREAQAHLSGLQKALEAATTRRNHYASLSFMNAGEEIHLDLNAQALAVDVAAEIVQALAPAGHQTPTLTAGSAGAWGSPVATVSYGGQNVGTGAEAAAQLLHCTAGLLRNGANMAATVASYERRAEEWKLQQQLAAKEMEQIQKQIDAANTRLTITKRDLAAHDRQIEQAKEVDAYLRDKLTGEALYDWMVTQLSTVYLRSYQLAYDVAKRAERAFQFDLGAQSAKFITFGYWDNVRQGLVAGEQLQHDLRRMEVAYLEQNKRELELTKQISLAQHDPEALLELLGNGTCNSIRIPEWRYDLDYPGHYFRRLKAVGLTVAGVSGPYASVNATLTLTNNLLRWDDTVPPGGTSYPRGGAGDSRFVTSRNETETIVTSHGQADAGLFEVNLRDERYLPFEGAGADSEWSLKIPAAFNQLRDHFSDIIFHVRYTARRSTKVTSSGVTLENVAEQYVRAAPEVLERKCLLSVRRDFPDAWQSLQTQPVGVQRSLQLPIGRDFFEKILDKTTVNITNIALFSRWPNNTIISVTAPAADSAKPITLATAPPFGDLTTGEWGGGLNVAVPESAAGVWKLSISANLAAPKDLWILVTYDAS